MAHYTWPPQWVGVMPEWARLGLSEVDPADLGELVVEREIPPGIRIRAFRDGMLAFDPGSWGDPVTLSEADPIEDFEAVAEYQVRIARLMNVHLACIHTAASPWSFKPTVVTPGLILSVRWSDGRLETALGPTNMGVELWKARTGRPEWNDWALHLRSGVPISTEAMEASFELLRKLVDRSDQEAVLLRAELLFRSAAAYSDHDSSAALVHAWTTTEGLLGDLLTDYLSGREGLNRPRREFFKGSEVTARITAEILSLGDRLPLPLYQAIVKAGRKRNEWLHKQEAVSSADAESAIRAAQELFERVEGVRLEMPLGRQLHSLG